MPYDDLLIHTLKAYRRPGSVDVYGQPIEATVSGTPHLTTVCRFSTPMGGKVASERTQEVFENQALVFVRSTADVREDDFVVVETSGGAELFRGRVHSRDEFANGLAQHHSSLEVWEQTGPSNGPGL